MISIVPIVEGKGDAGAIEYLLERYFAEVCTDCVVKVEKPVVAESISEIVKENGLEKFLEDAATLRVRSYASKAIIVLIDADKETCAGKYAGSLAQRAKTKAYPYPIAVVVAKRTFESWLIASIALIAANAPGFGISETIIPPSNPEDVSKPKDWLTDIMRRDLKFGYEPGTHQKRMAMYLDFTITQNTCPSFRRFVKTLEILVRVAPNPPRGFVMPSELQYEYLTQSAKPKKAMETKAQPHTYESSNAPSSSGNVQVTGSIPAVGKSTNEADLLTRAEKIMEMLKQPQKNKSDRPSTTVSEEMVTLLKDAQKGRAMVRTEQGEEFICGSIPPYPRREKDLKILACVTRREGKAISVVYVKDA